MTGHYQGYLTLRPNFLGWYTPINILVGTSLDEPTAIFSSLHVKKNSNRTLLNVTGQRLSGSSYFQQYIQTSISELRDWYLIVM
jgi:hypothetical protein